MQEFLSVIRSSTLFSGISEQELTAMLAWSWHESIAFPEGCAAAACRRYGGIDRSGAVRERSGRAGGRLGQPQYSVQGRAGTDLRRRLCLRTRFGAEGERRGGNTRDCAVSERQTRADHVPVRLRPAQPHHPQSFSASLPKRTCGSVKSSHTWASAPRAQRSCPTFPQRRSGLGPANLTFRFQDSSLRIILASSAAACRWSLDG